MYRVRFHGRGGQGMKTAGRILGSAFFASGFEVQDAPRYGAERRGAPMSAGVRAARKPIHERGVITHPVLVVVADDTLVAIPAAGVTAGVDESTVVLIASDEPAATWRTRLPRAREVLRLETGPDEGSGAGPIGVACAAAAARLSGVIGKDALDDALNTELTPLGREAVLSGRRGAAAAWDAFAGRSGLVTEGPDAPVDVAERPEWIELPFDPAHVSAPDIHAGATSVEVRTGLWRTLRPVVDGSRCHHCTWICAPLCPDGAIDVTAGAPPTIDLDHCKGCMVCVAVCPSHAIEAVPERDAAATKASP